MERYRDFDIRVTDPLPPIPGWKQFAFEFTHTDYDGEGDPRHGFEASVEDCKRQIDDLWEQRTLDALKGLVGLIDMIMHRDDLPKAVAEAIRDNHRLHEAEAVAGYRPGADLPDAAKARRVAVPSDWIVKDGA